MVQARRVLGDHRVAHVVPANAPKPRIDNTNLVAEFRAAGGRLIHFPPGRDRDRGFTVAYRRKAGRIEFATAVQHRNDTFTKKIGTATAILHFNNGQTVFLPMSKDSSVKTMFHWLDL